MKCYNIIEFTGKKLGKNLIIFHNFLHYKELAIIKRL